MGMRYTHPYTRLAIPQPLGTGKALYVVPASDARIPALNDLFPQDGDGVSRVFTTLSAAYDATVANRGDVIYMLPGSHTITANIAVSRAGITIQGLGPAGSVAITTSTVDTLTVTGDNFTMKNIHWVAATTLSCVVLTGCDNFLIEDCSFLSTVGGAGTYFIEMVTTANTLGKIKDCRFAANLDVSGGAVTMAGMIFGLGNRITIEDCEFDARRQTTDNAGAVTDGILFNAAADWGNSIKRCTFREHGGATFTNGIDYGTNVTDGGVFPTNNNFILATAGNAIVNGANSAGMANNIANGTV